MVAPAAHKLRRTLKQYDEAANAPVRKAIKKLLKVTQKVSEDPHKLALMPDDKDLWHEVVGEAYGNNKEFPGLVGNRWLQTLQKHGVASSGYDKADWDGLLQRLQAAETKLAAHGMSLVHMDELTALIQKLQAEAPESGGAKSDDDESSGDEPHEEHAKEHKDKKHKDKKHKDKKHKDKEHEGEEHTGEEHEGEEPKGEEHEGEEPKGEEH